MQEQEWEGCALTALQHTAAFCPAPSASPAVGREEKLLFSSLLSWYLWWFSLLF